MQACFMGTASLFCLTASWHYQLLSTTFQCPRSLFMTCSWHWACDVISQAFPFFSYNVEKLGVAWGQGLTSNPLPPPHIWTCYHCRCHAGISHGPRAPPLPSPKEMLIMLVLFVYSHAQVMHQEVETGQCVVQQPSLLSSRYVKLLHCG